MELYVFDSQLNRLGLIDEFVQSTNETHYTKAGSLNLIVDGKKENIDILQKGNILVKTDDLLHGYLIQTREYLDEQSSQLEIIAPSINVLLNSRLVIGQQTFTGDIEDVIKSFVQVNAVNPVNPNRVIPNLFISTNTGIQGTTTETGRDVPLDSFSYELCNKHDMSWDILLDIPNKQFIFHTWQGVDRTTEQSINPHVIFSKDRENILKQNYVESDSNYKNVAIVYSKDDITGEDVYVTVNDSISKGERLEVFIDASDLKRKYKNENGQEMALSIVEFQNLLAERGKKELAGYQKVVTFESDIDLYSNGVFGVDYFLGDKVSVINDDLGIIMHTRIISATEQITKSGTNLQISFGSNIPSLIDKLKRAVK